MELMIVVIIVGIMAAFAIPNYNKAVQKAHERDMLAQLISIHAANLLYRSYDGKYLVGSNGLAAINSNLSINIIANAGTTYNYTSAGGNTFLATAAWGAYTLQVTQGAIDMTSVPPNPCCQTNNCLAVANC